MRATATPRSGLVLAHAVVRELGETLGLPPLAEARPGADLWMRLREGAPLPPRAPLLRAADGWVHPGPPTAWSAFTDLAIALGAPVPAQEAPLPDVSMLAAEAVDAEAGAWLVPAVAVRDVPAAAPEVRLPRAPPDLTGAEVVVLGTAWATPLAGLALARLGARVTRVDDPRRPDPFPLRDRLAAGQARVAPDLATPGGRDALAVLLARADLLVDGYTPRVLDNVGFADPQLRHDFPRLATLRVAAFVDGDRPGYGPAAECRGGWASRYDPPRLGRSSVADPVAGLFAALAAVDLLAPAGAPGGRARVSLEGAIGLLLAREVARA
jgi:CoA-transferase family III